MKLDETKTIVDDLFKKYDLRDWSFKFDNSLKRFGQCSYTKKRITLSKRLTLLNDYNTVKDTILHEIAHILVGAKAKHGYIWKQKAIEIGCKGETYVSEDTIRVAKKWKGQCPSCKRTIQRHRRDMYLACGKCCGDRYNENYKFNWVENKNI